MLQATQLRPGFLIKHEGELYSIFSASHRTPGNKRGFVQTRMRNLRSGAMVDHRFSSEDRVERAILDAQEMEYLYRDGEDYHFMNTETYEQTHLRNETLGETMEYLVPNLKITVEFYDGKPVGIQLPATVDLEVVETEPSLKGATASNMMKPAKLETGLVVHVPPFVNTGDKVRVNTAAGTYQERAQ